VKWLWGESQLDTTAGVASPPAVRSNQVNAHTPPVIGSGAFSTRYANAASVAVKHVASIHSRL